MRDASRTDPRLIVDTSDKQTADDGSLKTVALWWWLLPVAGVPWIAGLLLSLCAIGAGIAVLVRAARGSPVARE